VHRLLVCLALLFLSLPRLSATPEAAVRAYVAAVKTGGLGSVARLMHPEELAKFQEMMKPVIELALTESEGREVFGRFSDSADETKLRALNSEAFMTTFLESIEALQPEISELLKSAEIEVLGHVKEGVVSHVVTRLRVRARGATLEQMTVMSTRDHEGTERLMLSGEIRQLAEALRSQQ